MSEPMYSIVYSDGTTDSPLPWARVIARLRAFNDLSLLKPVRVELER